MKSEEKRRKGRSRAEVQHARRVRELRRELAEGGMTNLLNTYVRVCHGDLDGEIGDAKRGGKRALRVPNPAGFCRFLGIEEAAYDALLGEFPTEAGRLRAIFVDEAFNASLTPSVLSLYLKLFFGEGDGEPGGGDALSVTFEHDILLDGQ